MHMLPSKTQCFIRNGNGTALDLQNMIKNTHGWSGYFPLLCSGNNKLQNFYDSLALQEDDKWHAWTLENTGRISGQLMPFFSESQKGWDDGVHNAYLGITHRDGEWTKIIFPKTAAYLSEQGLHVMVFSVQKKSSPIQHVSIVCYGVFLNLCAILLTLSGTTHVRIGKDSIR